MLNPSLTKITSLISMFTAVGQIDSRSETTGIQLNPLGQTSQGR